MAKKKIYTRPEDHKNTKEKFEKSGDYIFIAIEVGKILRQQESEKDLKFPIWLKEACIDIYNHSLIAHESLVDDLKTLESRKKRLAHNRNLDEALEYMAREVAKIGYESGKRSKKGTTVNHFASLAKEKFGIETRRLLRAWDKEYEFSNIAHYNEMLDPHKTDEESYTLEAYEEDVEPEHKRLDDNIAKYSKKFTIKKENLNKQQ